MMIRYVLPQVEYTGGACRSSSFMLRAPWGAQTAETPVLWLYLLMYPLPVLPEHEITS